MGSTCDRFAESSLPTLFFFFFAVVSHFELLVPPGADKQAPSSATSPDSASGTSIVRSKCGEEVENPLVTAAPMEQHLLLEAVRWCGETRLVVIGGES